MLYFCLSDLVMHVHGSSHHRQTNPHIFSFLSRLATIQPKVTCAFKGNLLSAAKVLNCQVALTSKAEKNILPRIQARVTVFMVKVTGLPPQKGP